MNDLDAAAIAPLAIAEMRKMKFAIWAPNLAARYGGRVVLIGTALEQADPRDVDVRVIMADESAFCARFECTVDSFRRTKPPRWVADMAKLGNQMSVWSGENVDLQVWPASYWEHDRASLGLAVLAEAPVPPDA